MKSFRLRKYPIESCAPLTGLLFVATTLLAPVIRYRAPRESSASKATRKQFTASFLKAVEHTRHYRTQSVLADQLGKVQVGKMEMSSWLTRLPKVELLDYLKNGDRFKSDKPPRPRKRSFVHPCHNQPRTAVLAEGFRFSLRYKRIEDYRNPRLARLKSESIAAPLDTLRALARGIETGHLWIPPLTHSVVAFAGLVEGPLSEEDLDLFWRVFQVPIHEQFYGFSGELLAWECEAHQGLHINPKSAVFEEGNSGELLVSLIGNPYQPVFRLVSGLSGSLVSTECACGLAGPRIMNLMRRTERLRQTKVIPMAATAS